MNKNVTFYPLLHIFFSSYFFLPFLLTKQISILQQFECIHFLLELEHESRHDTFPYAV